MFINTTGIVLRDVKYGDNTKILTVLTSTHGKITVSAHGAYRKNSKIAVSTGLLVYSEMTLTQRKDRWTLTEASVIEQFLGLRDDLPLFALGAYIAELVEVTADEDSLNPKLLPLCLNTLYALSEKIKPHTLIKPAFELRLMCIAGYEPVLKSIDGETDAGRTGEGEIYLSQSAFSAAKYILTSNPKKIFSFTIEERTLRELTICTEEYLLTHLDRHFKTLDYYKKTAQNA